MESMWAVDVEGSGMSAPEIVELAIVELNGLHFTGKSRCWRCKPKNGISPIAARIHGIRETDVDDAPEVEDIAASVRDWLGNRTIIGHNVRVDYSLLARSLVGWQPKSAIDTLRLSRLLLPDQEKHGLERLGAVLELDVLVKKETGSFAHSALFDASVAGRLFIQLLELLSARNRDDAMLKADILRGTQGSLL